jgi:hypothetical protein
MRLSVACTISHSKSPRAARSSRRTTRRFGHSIRRVLGLVPAPHRRNDRTKRWMGFLERRDGRRMRYCTIKYSNCHIIEPYVIILRWWSGYHPRAFDSRNLRLYPSDNDSSDGKLNFHPNRRQGSSGADFGDSLYYCKSSCKPMWATVAHLGIDAPRCTRARFPSLFLFSSTPSSCLVRD